MALSDEYWMESHVVQVRKSSEIKIPEASREPPLPSSLPSQPVDDDAATPLDGARSALKSLPWSPVSWPPRLLWLLTICILLLIWWFVLLLLFPTY